MSRSGRPPTSPSFSFYYVSNMPVVTLKYGPWNHVCVCWFLATSGTIPSLFSFRLIMHACTHAINPKARERNEGNLGNKRWVAVGVDDPRDMPDALIPLNSIQVKSQAAYLSRIYC